MRYLKGLALVVVFSLVSIAIFAADAVAGTVVAVVAQEWWKGLLGGIAGGVMAAVLGWFKNKDAQTGSQEAFGTQYMWQTMLVGALVGVASYFMKMSPTDVISWLEASPFYAGITVVVEMVLKAIFRHSAPLLRDILKIILGGSLPNPTVPPATPPAPGK
jgi:energy-converting hydrogenase Eha subunit B